MPERKLAVRTRPIAGLVPFANNARTHSDAQIEQIAKSIEEFGWTNPVLIDEDGGIVAGHCRVLAAEGLGLTSVPTITLTGLSEAQRRAYVLADNKLALNAGWDENILSIELTGLSDMDFDLSVLGFDDLDLVKFLAHGVGETDPDDTPDPPANPVSRPGDIWILGDHRLMCGDCGFPSELEKVMAGVVADLVVTSPPYNQKIDEFTPSGMQKKSPNFVNRMASAYPDSVKEDEYQNKQVEILDIIHGFIADDASLFYNHKIRYRDKSILHPMDWLRRTKYKIRQEIIWARGSSITLNARMFIPADERIYWMRAGNEVRFNNTTEIKAWTNIWNIAPVNDVPISAAFATEIPRRCIEATTNPNDLILDPFVGSGTTIIAAEMEGRCCYALEIAPAYVDVTVERWQQFTGKQATREADGRAFDELKATLVAA